MISCPFLPYYWWINGSWTVLLPFVIPTRCFQFENKNMSMIYARLKTRKQEKYSPSFHQYYYLHATKNIYATMKGTKSNLWYINCLLQLWIIGLAKNYGGPKCVYCSQINIKWIFMAYHNTCFLENRHKWMIMSMHLH